MTSILYDLAFVTDFNYLTLASNICKAVSQDQEITKSVFQISPQPDWLVSPWLFNRKSMAHAQTLVHRWGTRTWISVLGCTDGLNV